MNDAVLQAIGKIGEILTGTCVGALIAFQVKELQDQRNEDRKNRAAANYAVYLLQRHIDELMNLEVQCLFEWRTGPKRDIAWARLTPVHANRELPPMRIEELAWMLERSNPNLLSKLTVARSLVVSVHNALDRRNRIHEEAQRAQALIEQELKSSGVPLSPGFAIDRFSEKLMTDLRGTVEQLFELSAEALRYQFEMAEEMQAAMDAIWDRKKLKVLRITPQAEILKSQGISPPWEIERQRKAGQH